MGILDTVKKELSDKFDVTKGEVDDMIVFLFEEEDYGNDMRHGADYLTYSLGVKRHVARAVSSAWRTNRSDLYEEMNMAENL